MRILRNTAIAVFIMVIGFGAAACGDDESLVSAGVEGMIWTAVPDSTFGTSAIRGVSFINGKFYAVGESGKIAHSTDGITWTAVTTSFTETLNAIAYGAGRYVLVGNNHFYMHSTDLETWINCTPLTGMFGSNNTTDRHALAIAYSDAKFFIGGSGGRVVHSPDPTGTWTQWSHSLESYDGLTNVFYAEGVYLVGGARNKMAFSTNGSTLREITSIDHHDVGEIRAFAYGNGRYVTAAGSNSIIYNDGTFPGVWTRISGTAAVFGDAAPRGMVFGNDRFVIAGTRGFMAHSEKAEVWIAAKDSTFSSGQIIFDVAFGNGVFVAVGQGGRMAYYDTAQ